MQKMLKEIDYYVGSFNPFSIAERLNIDFEYRDFSPDIEGVSFPVLGKPLIALNSALVNIPKRYVVMSHELYHAIAHPDLINYYTIGENQRSSLEYEANKFTAMLLLNFYPEFTGHTPLCFGDIQQQFQMEDNYIQFYF